MRDAEVFGQADSLRSLAGTRLAEQDEAFLDMATAVSGSGPAYVFLFLEALIDAGVHVGLPRPIATELAVETVIGAGLIAR